MPPGRVISRAAFSVITAVIISAPTLLEPLCGDYAHGLNLQNGTAWSVFTVVKISALSLLELFFVNYHRGDNQRLDAPGPVPYFDLYQWYKSAPRRSWSPYAGIRTTVLKNGLTSACPH
jgi:hypothetical protein